MCAFQLFLTVDPSLGRVDCSLLSDQTLMEMLIEDLDNETKKTYQDNEGMYLDVCKWPCVTCDDKERVTEIRADSRDIRGSIQLCYVPPKVTELKIGNSMTNGRLTGPVDLTCLPEAMKQLYLDNNELTGEIELTQLPEGMEDLRLNNNLLTGKVDLTRLPEGMRKLHLDNNGLTGEIDLTRLPEGINVLQLQYNRLTREIDLRHLPEEMLILQLQYNQFTGEVDLSQLPNSMRELHLGHNKLTGDIDLAHLPCGMQNLSLNDNELTGDIDLAHVPHAIYALHLQNNQLSGSFVIKRRKGWISINAQGNQFNAVAVLHSETSAAIKLRGSGVTTVVDENGRKLDIRRFMR